MAAADATESTMQGPAFKTALKRVGLSLRKAAPFFGLSLSTVFRINAGDYPAPVAVEKLLNLMIKNKLTAEDVE